MRRLMSLSVCLFLLASVASAQEAYPASAIAQAAIPFPAPAPPQTPPPARPTTAPPSSPVAPISTPPQSASKPNPSDVNISVELTITETGGSGGSQKKTVLLVTQNGNRGSVRSQVPRPGSGENPGFMILNVDVRPTTTGFMGDGRINLNLTLQYSPDAATENGSRVADLTESMTVVVNDGKKMLIAQSADPKGDRKVAVEVTASVIR